MTDKTTGKPMRVSKYGRSVSYLIVPVEQISAVKAVRDCGNIRYWVEETTISLNGGPTMAVVNFGKSMPPGEIPTELDKVG